VRNKKELQKIVTRFYYPIALEAWFLASTKGQKEFLGVGFSDVIFKFDGKTAEVFRIADELHNKVKTATFKYIKTEKFFKYLPEYERLISEYHKLLNNKKADIKEIIKYFSKVYQLLGVSYFVSNLWINDIPVKKRKEIISLCEKYRKLSDGILIDLDKYVVKFLKRNNLSLFTTLKDIENPKKSVQKLWLEKGFIFSSGNFLNITWPQFLSKNNFFYNKEQINTVDGVLQGSAVFPGLVKGLVKIVFSLSDFKKVKKGDILISPMTQPNFIPILSKVKGIVTDEGGITSHAAIVARELRKPCIIGTKIATRVLKDGDLVEVDANKGVVNILKRK